LAKALQAAGNHRGVAVTGLCPRSRKIEILDGRVMQQSTRIEEDFALCNSNLALEVLLKAEKDLEARKADAVCANLRQVFLHMVIALSASDQTVKGVVCIRVRNDYFRTVLMAIRSGDPISCAILYKDLADARI
jgi:hypothetical protein